MAKKPRISVASDHAGYILKKEVVNCLRKEGYEVHDWGIKSDKTSVNYPDYAALVVKDLLRGWADRGVLVCGTGIGMSIAANRFEGIRAAVVHDLTTADVAARHNHANILCLGGRLIAPHLGVQLVRKWLDSPFEPRHKERIRLIEKYAHKLADS